MQRRKMRQGSLRLADNASVTFASEFGGLQLQSSTKQPRKCRGGQRLRANVYMLRVRRSRLPRDWGDKSSSLSGKFLPLDPKDENVLEALEDYASGAKYGKVDDDFGEEGQSASAYQDSAESGRTGEWSKRSEGAKKRWSDPLYRQKMLEKRAEKKKANAAARGPTRHRIEIGTMDSITLCDDDKARAINDYARSNRLKSEKLTAYHRDRRTWMETRLSQGEDLRWRLNRVEYKKQRQDKRREEARRRHARKRAREQAQEQKLDDESGSNSTDS